MSTWKPTLEIQRVISRPAGVGAVPTAAMVTTVGMTTVAVVGDHLVTLATVTTMSMAMAAEVGALRGMLAVVVTVAVTTTIVTVKITVAMTVAVAVMPLRGVLAITEGTVMASNALLSMRSKDRT